VQYNGFSVSSDITVCKKWSRRSVDGLNKKRGNRFFQRVGMPQSIQIHLLWRGLSSPMTVFLSITMFLAIPKRHFNGRGASNGHIASLWQSPILCCSVIPPKFKFFKPASCEVFYGTSCSFSNFAFFLLSFLAFFPMI
jgi:hypothetical protein